MTSELCCRENKHKISRLQLESAKPHKSHIRAHLDSEILLRFCSCINMNSLCHIINLSVVMIAYVCCCHLNSTPDLHLLQASDHDRCKNMIAADERKVLSLHHRGTRERVRDALLSLPFTFEGNFKGHQ